MTKAEFVNEIPSKTGVNSKETLQIVEGFMDCVKTSLSSKKEGVFLRGFGSFIMKRRAEKMGRNISKNTNVLIPAHDVPAFKPSFKLEKSKAS